MPKFARPERCVFIRSLYTKHKSLHLLEMQNIYGTLSLVLEALSHSIESDDDR